MAKKELTPAEVELKELKAELDDFFRAVKVTLKEFESEQKDIEKDIVKAEKVVAKEKAAKAKK